MDVRVGLGILCFSHFSRRQRFSEAKRQSLRAYRSGYGHALHPTNSGLFLNSKNILNKKCRTNWLKS